MSQPVCAQPFPWPDSAAAPPGNAASTLQAAWLDGSILLRWHLRALYAGGAAPGPSRARPAASAGSCLLDAATGGLQRAPADVDGPAAQAPLQLPCADPAVLAQALLGGIVYRLQRQPLAGDKVRSR